MKNILITGANRGIGLMFAQSFADVVNTVYGTARDINNCDELKKIKNIEILELDLLDKNSIKSFCAEVKDIPFDLILNNAGTFQDEQMEETNLDPELWLDEIMINAIGPITLTQKLKENLMSGVDKKVVFISSQMGSIDDNYSGGYYFYRTSKSRSRESGGFGLGLYLCKQIVLAHQGLLSISNHEEKGAVITIQIPMEQ